MQPPGTRRRQEPSWVATLLVVVAVGATCLYTAARLRASVMPAPGASGSAAPAGSGSVTR